MPCRAPCQLSPPDAASGVPGGNPLAGSATKTPPATKASPQTPTSRCPRVPPRPCRSTRRNPAAPARDRTPELPTASPSAAPRRRRRPLGTRRVHLGARRRSRTPRRRREGRRAQRCRSRPVSWSAPVISGAFPVLVRPSVTWADKFLCPQPAGPRPSQRSGGGLGGLCASRARATGDPDARPADCGCRRGQRCEAAIGSRMRVSQADLTPVEHRHARHMPSTCPACSAPGRRSGVPHAAWVPSPRTAGRAAADRSARAWAKSVSVPAGPSRQATLGVSRQIIYTVPGKVPRGWCQQRRLGSVPNPDTVPACGRHAEPVGRAGGMMSSC
jgi:hypothetical protein